MSFNLLPVIKVRFQAIRNFGSPYFVRQTVQKTLALLMLICLPATTIFAVPETPKVLLVTFDELKNDIRYAAASNSVGMSFMWFDTLKELIGGTKGKQEVLERIEIQPVNGDNALAVMQGETVHFSAVGYRNGQAAHGLTVDWTVSNADRSQTRRLNNGVFVGRRPGVYTVTAVAEGVQKTITVEVRFNEGLGIQRLLNKPDSERSDRERQSIQNMRTRGILTSREINSRDSYDRESEMLLSEIDRQKREAIRLIQEERRQQQPDGTVQPARVSQAPTEKQEAAVSDESEAVAQNDIDSNQPDYRGKGGPNVDENEIEQTHKPLQKRFSVKKISSSPMMRPLEDDGWGGDNWWTADDPGNQVGNPPGTSPDAGAGNGNFQITTPVVALPGRGMDVNLSLTYNSRLWSKSDNTMSFDSDKGNPAPGWSLGFGKMIYMGSNGGCMLVDADGTRRGYTGTNNTYSNGSYFSNNFTGHATDGSFIDYNCYFSSSTYGTYLSGSAKLPNGTIVYYGSQSLSNDQVYPTQITDAQGNYITITYVNNRGPNINTVTDTMGRIINFNYDSLNRLISVTVPGFNGGTARTVLRLHYKTLNLNYAFASGIATDTNNPSPYVLDAIYYPGTDTGYWFGDADSYSSYGMIAKVVEQRGMIWSGTPGDQGTVTAGTTSRQAVYDYPLTPNSSLTDAPTYSNLTESWDGMDTTSAVTQYQTFMNSTPRTITVTHPNGIKSKQYMYNASGAWNDGLIYLDETLAPDNTVLSKSEVTWQQGHYDTARPYIAVVTDEQQQTLKTELSYGSVYNQVISKKEFDYNNGPLLRDTRSTYENSPSYTNKHIFNLVKSNEVYDGAGVRITKTSYEYDNNAVVNGTSNHGLVATPNVIMHKASSDPYTTETTQVAGACLLWDPAENSDPPCSYDGESVWVVFPESGNGEGYFASCTCMEYEYFDVSVYDPNSVFRGNITKITSYADATNLSGVIQETRRYDVTGNFVEQSNSTSNPIDELVALNYDVSTQYAYPTSQTEGSPDPNSALRNTVNSVYDFNTGLIKQTIDKNGRTNSVTYNPDNLRPIISTSSTGSYQQTIYDDEAMSVTEEAYEYGGNLTSKNKKFLNGTGKVKREETLGISNIWDITETTYTNLGQVWKQSRPYRSGDTPQWTENIYDIQGRVSQVVEADGSTVQAFYNETSRPGSASNLLGQTVRTVDAWGRERWERYDKDSKLVEVVEPDPNGNGSVFTTGSLVTTYKVDVVGRLIETEQGDQHRYFKYNSFGQLIRQKLAEQTATLNDAGQYVGAGNPAALWSEAAWYDDQANLIMEVDARGVKTNYSYQINGAKDPLNRLHSKWYDLSGPLDSNVTIHAAPAVTYSYMTSGDKMRIRQVRTAGILTEDYGYDVEGRVTDYTQTVDYRSSYPMTISYIYDSLDRITDIRYPAQYGLAGNPRKIVHNSFDVASRLTNLTYDGQQQAGNIAYDAADRATSVSIGSAGNNQVTELYTYDAQNGLLTSQRVIRNGQTLMDLSYDYQRNTSNGTLNGKTGHLTKILDNLNHDKDREFKYDAIARLSVAKGGVNSVLWQQQYSYDRYGNRINVTASGTAADASPIPTDGHANLTYNSTSNKITTAGFEYDSAGNQTRALAEDGLTWLRFEYDAANRLQIVKKDDGTNQQAFQYSSGNQRLMSHDYVANQLTIFAAHNGTVAAEYTEFAYTVPTWTKSYTYLGDKILSTISPNGQGGESVEYSHPDRLGTRLITNQQNGASFEQTTLPFGTALNAESTGSTVRRFTSYERSDRTGLDYAQNRTYDSKQGRFTQVDPIGMSSVDLRNPQTLNLFSYCANDPINHTDPDGLFFGFLKKFFKWLGKALKWIALAVAIVVAVITIVLVPASAALWFKVFTIVGALASVASQVFEILGLKTLATIFGIIGAVTDFGKSLYNKLGTKLISFAKDGVKAVLGVVKSGAALASKVLTAFGQKTAAGIMGFINSIAGAVDSVLTQKAADVLKDGKTISKFKYGLEKDFFTWYKAVRSAAQATATVLGAKTVASVFANFGFITDVQDIVNGAIEMGKALMNFDAYAAAKGDKLQYTWKGVRLTDPEKLKFAKYNSNTFGQLHFYLRQANTIGSALNRTYTNLNR